MVLLLASVAAAALLEQCHAVERLHILGVALQQGFGQLQGLLGIADLDFEIACFGHSAAIVGGAGGSFRAFVAGI